MAMTSGSRRVLLYWVLLLLPTLAVGGGVIWLLGREQTRLDEQSRAAQEARKAAVGARARLIAENVEVLVGDVEAGLMTTLREAPADDGRAGFLKDWQRTNPLVRETFDFSRGNAGGGLYALLAAQEAIQPSPPSSSDVAAAFSQQQASVSNSGQLAVVRYNLLEVSKLKGGDSKSVERTGWYRWREEGGRLRLIGWRRMAFGEMIAVEVKLPQVAASLGDILPADREPGEVYELREVGGRVYQQKMLTTEEQRVAGRLPLIRVPVSESVLPGWEVVGFLSGTDSRSSAGGTLFAVSAVLAGVLVAAILAGGTLLLRQARRSDEEAAQKTSFVANVSHEFKTPLTTIRLYAELLEQGRVPDEARRLECLRTIGRETQRLARLVNNALDFSRLEQGKRHFGLVDLDVADELARLLDTHAPRVAEAGLSLRRDFSATLPKIRCDADAFGQIMINLLDNACKYATGGGEVAVSAAARPSGGVEVRVADRGPGVPSGQAERIFEKFHRADEALTAEKGGAGLGLSIARQLARGLGGELRCAGREGGGAEFILELP